MATINVNEASLRQLNYLVAQLCGWAWAKNMVGRYGDSCGEYQNGKKHVAGWPIGSRFFIRPEHAKNLDFEKQNWAGWCKSDGTEPIGPNAFYGLPRYCEDWSDGGPILEQMKPHLWFDKPLGKFVCSNEYKPGFGETMLIAGMRCYIRGKLGNMVDVPEEL